MSQADKHPLEAALLDRILIDVVEIPVEPVPVPPPVLPEITQIQKHLPEFHDTTKDPKYEVKNEKPWHRILAYMLLQGTSQSACADYFGKSTLHISQVKKQPWFQKLLAELADLNFQSDVLGLLQSEAITAIATLSDLAQNAESETVKRSAASTLLENFLKHKPEPKPKESKSPQQELDELNAELRALESK